MAHQFRANYFDDMTKTNRESKKYSGRDAEEESADEVEKEQNEENNKSKELSPDDEDKPTRSKQSRVEKQLVQKRPEETAEHDSKDAVKTIPVDVTKETENRVTSNKKRKRVIDKERTTGEESLATRQLEEQREILNISGMGVSLNDETDNFAIPMDAYEKDEDNIQIISPSSFDRKTKKRTKSAKNTKDVETSSETSGEKPCPKVTGINAGAIRVLGTGGIKGTSLPLLLSMSAGSGSAGGLSLLPAGLPPGRYVILPSTTSSVPSVTNIAASTIHSGTKIITAPTSCISSAILSTTPSMQLRAPASIAHPSSVAPFAAGRFNSRTVKSSLKGTFGNRGAISIHGRRKSYTAAEKLAMIAAVESGQRKSAVADMFGVAPSTLACILLQKHKIRSDQVPDLSRRRLRQPKPSLMASSAVRAIASKGVAREERDFPFGTHFMSSQSPFSMFDESPEEIVSVPDFEDRMNGGDGTAALKLEESCSGGFLSCSSAIPISADEPVGLQLQIPSNDKDGESYYEDDDDDVKVKLEPPLPPEIEIDDENILDNTRSSSPISRPPSPTPSGMTGPYLLKKETHCSSILDELLKDETFTDVTLTAEGQHINAHRIILCLSSKYFKDVLSKESTAKNIIFFRDLKFEELKNIITFIYTGEVTVDASDLESFMKTAELLEVTSLCDGHKNFPKGFPTSQNSGAACFFKPTSSTTKRTSPSSAYSPPSKSRKTTESTSTCKSRRKRNQQPAPTPCYTIKAEPAVSENDSPEKETEVRDTFVDGSQINEEEGLSTTQFKDALMPEKEKYTASEHVADVSLIPGKCPFCPSSRQLFKDPTMLTHLQVSHPEETAYPCDICYTVFTKKLSYLDHHKDCKR